MRKRHRISRCGFSLIELLVVIAVILILIRLLLPSVSSARRRAWDVVCVNNLREISVAFALYVQDNQNYPAAHPSGSDNTIMWMPALLKFTSNNTKIFECPFGEQEAKTLCTAGNWGANPNNSFPWKGEPIVNEKRWVSYGYNEWGTTEGTRCGFGGWYNSPACCRKEGAIKAGLSDLFLVGDSVADCVWDSALDGDDNIGDGNEYLSTRHSGRGFVVHGDGHVDSYKQINTINGSPPANPNWELYWNVNGKNGLCTNPPD